MSMVQICPRCKNDLTYDELHMDVCKKCQRAANPKPKTKAVVPRRILDLLVREVNYAWWSEGCLFNLTEAEAGEVEKFMAAYNRDEHLNLIINYEEE